MSLRIIVTLGLVSLFALNTFFLFNHNGHCATFAALDANERTNMPGQAQSCPPCPGQYTPLHTPCPTCTCPPCPMTSPIPPPPPPPPPPQSPQPATTSLPSSSRSDSKLRIAIISAAYPADLVSKAGRDFEAFKANRLCYAGIHDYTFIFETDDFLTGTDRPEDANLFKHWNKVAALRKHIGNFDWVLWTDFDVMFTNFDRKIEEFLQLDVISNDATKEYHLILPQEYDGQRDFSNYIFAVRNSYWGRYFLDLWWEERIPCPMVFYDQGPMYNAIIGLLARMTGDTSYDGEMTTACDCTESCANVYIGDSVPFFNDWTKRLGYGYGMPNKPPVFFTPLDHRNGETGIGFSCTQGPTKMKVDQVLPKSFAIHKAHKARGRGVQRYNELKLDSLLRDCAGKGRAGQAWHQPMTDAGKVRTFSKP